MKITLIKPTLLGRLLLWLLPLSLLLGFGPLALWQLSQRATTGVTIATITPAVENEAKTAEDNLTKDSGSESGMNRSASRPDPAPDSATAPAAGAAPSAGAATSIPRPRAAITAPPASRPAPQGANEGPGSAVPIPPPAAPDVPIPPLPAPVVPIPPPAAPVVTAPPPALSYRPPPANANTQAVPATGDRLQASAAATNDLSPWLWSSGVVLLTWLVGLLGLRRSLGPLYTLADEIAARHPGRLDALAAPDLPELRPAVGALNALLAELRETLGRLQAQEAAARRFAYNASHELRNPLAAARNSLAVLEGSLGQQAGAAPTHPPRPAHHSEALARANAALERTERILGGLLSLARLEGHGQLRRENVDLSNFLEANFELTVVGAAMPGQVGAAMLGQVGAATPGQVGAERALLELAVENLVQNALTHGASRVWARLEAQADVGPSSGGEERLWLWLEDDGPGFLPALLPRVFEAFVSGGSSTGLGLAIVAAVAELHGAALRAENRFVGADVVGARVGLGFRATPAPATPPL
jgi:signal transduction histidine kinase